MVGVSACLAVSNIPWGGPIGCLEVGYVDGQIVMNPNQEQRHSSKLDLTVAATKEKVVMIEAGADQIPDDVMYDAIVKALRDQNCGVHLNKIVAEIGKEKMTYDHADFKARAVRLNRRGHHGLKTNFLWTPTKQERA